MSEDRKKDVALVTIMSASFIVSLLGARWSYGAGSALPDFLLYQFSHANVWHWAANFLVLLSFKPRVSTWSVAYAVSVFAAMADAWIWGEETCGMSALACAAVARKFVAWRNEKGWPEKTVLTVISLGMMALLPRINWHVHLIAFGMGYASWLAWYTFPKENFRALWQKRTKN